MADNPYKRAIVNRALAIMVSGRTAQAGMFFTSLDDTEFADWTTVSETDYPDARLAVANYENVLKQVLEDILPDFACEYADLGQWHRINQEYGGWDYLFELPTDFLALDKQCYEGDPLGAGVDCEVMHFKGYSHVVRGTDDQAYYCSADHTSADADKPITGVNYANYWTLYNADGGFGATWASGVAYKKNSTGKMLATNHATNDDGDSAYIRYIAYVRTLADGTVGRSDQPQYYPESFANAFATRLAAELALISLDYGSWR
jgi:hypothetical protein